MNKNLYIVSGLAVVVIFSALLLFQSDNEAQLVQEDSEIFENFISLNDAISEAEESGKMVLIDVYTEWCGFCRRMNTETYADTSVKEALDKYYHVVRLDAESDDIVTFQGVELTKQEFAESFGIYSFPTTVFLEPDSAPFASQPGFIEAETFHKLLVYVGTEAYKFTPFDEFELN